VSVAALVEALPDWIAFVRPDGLVTNQAGGRAVPLLAPRDGAAAHHLRDLLPPEMAALVQRMVRRSLADRKEVESDFDAAPGAYRIRVLPQGPQRALCVIRGTRQAGDDTAASEPLRSGFLAELQQRVVDARLRERPLAVGVLSLDGLDDIGRSIDYSIADQLHALIFAKLAGLAAQSAHGESCLLARLGESSLGFAIEGAADRDRIEALAASLQAGATAPVQLGDAVFRLTAAVGIAVLGRDGSDPELLLACARSAMFEARRSTGSSIVFYSDTLSLLPVARLDIERQLREAIAADEIQLEYLPRHDLRTGELTGLHAYMRWVHPIFGEIAPARFLPVAEATGLAPALSRTVLERLAADCAERRIAERVPVSFGALRQHIASGQLIDDCRTLIANGHLCTERFELRIDERTLTSLPEAEKTLGALTTVGAHLIIDEVGRQVSPILRLAQLPLSALQIDRALVVASRTDHAAQRGCRALVALAHALEIGAIAGGIDDEETRRRMALLGCQQGMGDRYPRRRSPMAPEHLDAVLVPGEYAREHE
jgi:predicted signal transduction protein with EAL and GGDEF domain